MYSFVNVFTKIGIKKTSKLYSLLVFILFQSFIVFTLPGMRVRCTVPLFSISTF